MLAGFILLSGCMTSSPYDRGSLSDAMDKSKDDADNRRVPNKRDKPAPWEQDDDYNEDISAADEAVYYGSGEDFGSVYLGLRSGNAWVSTPYFDSLIDMEALLGFRETNVEGIIFGGIKAVTAKESSAVYDSVDEGVVFLRAGLELRYYPFPDLHFMSPFVLAQAGGIYMYWSFKNPLQAGPETIYGDSIGGMMLGTGIGVNLIDTAVFRLGASVMPETHLFYGETQQGFQNDVFDYYSTVRWAIEAGIVLGP